MLNAKIAYIEQQFSFDGNKAMLATLLLQRDKHLLSFVVMQPHTVSNNASCMRIM